MYTHTHIDTYTFIAGMAKASKSDMRSRAPNVHVFTRINTYTFIAGMVKESKSDVRSRAPAATLTLGLYGLMAGCSEVALLTLVFA
jgi:hypothetical protein